MDSTENTVARQMELLTPKEFADQFKNEGMLELVGVKAYERRRVIANAIKATNQDDMEDSFAEGDGTWSFDVGGEVATERCNYLVTTGEISAIIPKTELPGSEQQDKTLPPATYLYRMPMIEWTKKHIKSNYVNPHMKTGYLVAIGEEKYKVGRIY